MLPTTEVKRRNERSGSLNQCFLILGMDRKLLYTRNRRIAKRSCNCHRSNLISRVAEVNDEPISYLLRKATELFRECAKKYHPDKHKYHKNIYEQKFDEARKAYVRACKILKRKRAPESVATVYLPHFAF